MHAKNITVLIFIFIISFQSCNWQSSAESDMTLTDPEANIIQNSNLSLTINDLTKQILRKEIELERLNVEFRQKTTLTSCWRQRRMFAYGEGNSGMTEAGLLTALPSQYQVASFKKHYGQKTRPSTRVSQRNNIEAGSRLSLIANSYGAGGDLLELGINYLNYCSLKKEGFTPNKYRSKVRKLRTEIDQLLTKRRSILAQAPGLSDVDKVTAEQENKVLGDLRDLTLIEYMDYHHSCKKFWLVQNAAYINDFAKNCVGGAGNIAGLEGNHLRHTSLFGTSGLLILISGVIILGTPLVGRVTGNVSGLAARRIVSQESLDLHNCTVNTYRLDYQNFLESCKTFKHNSIYTQGALARIPLYEEQQRIMTMKERYLAKEKKEAHKTLVENIVFASIVGPTKIANGTLTMIGGWHYAHNPFIASRLFAAGTTAYVPGAAFAFLETTRLWASFERNNIKLKNSELLPSNQLNRRLRMLDNMNSILGSNNM